MQKSVFVIDDHAIVREGLKAIARRLPGVDICGEASSAEEALESLAGLRPDLILLDVELPGLSGLEILPRLVRRGRPVVVLSLHDCANLRHRAMEAGAHAYLVKGNDVDVLMEAMRRALHLPVLADKSPLTDRERDILRLIAAGHTSREIAELRHISYHTVERHRTNMARKLNLSKRSELIRYGLEYLRC
jgi:DNA-binding NarL/FixJ family response regulator